MRLPLALAYIVVGVAAYAEYDEKLARGPMVTMAAASYSDDPQKCMDNAMKGAKVLKQVTLDCDYFHDACSAFVVVDDANKAIGLAYRGSTSAAQILDEVEESAFEKHVAFSTGGKVSKYFNDAFTKLLDGGILAALKEARTAHPDYECWVAGHSLGGALAAMGGAYVSANGICAPEKLKQYTFGQPRVGDKTWANNHDTFVPATFRIAHHQDIVAHIPPEFFGYRHHMAEVYYNNTMAVGEPFRICAAQESHACSEGDVNLSGEDHSVYFSHELGDWGRAGCV